jgi:hypothetical protein
MRKEFELSQKDLDEILDAGKPVTYIVVGGHPPSSPQENANRAWKRMGEKYGFVWDTARPVTGKGRRFITAVEES